MSKTSERLEGYQTQMSIYAEQHKVILASDVLDMIEQLQDDLKDDVEKLVAKLEEVKGRYRKEDFTYRGILEKVSEIVSKGGVK